MRIITIISFIIHQPIIPIIPIDYIIIISH